MKSSLKSSLKLSDSHCHLHMLEWDKLETNLEGVIEAAEQNGIQHMLCVGTLIEDLSTILEITNRYPHIYASVGLHPNEATEREPEAKEIAALASAAKVVAIGETGLDYYRSEGDLKWQQDRFRTHIEAARMSQKPLIIHTRQARQDTIQILKECRASEIGGVFHCFTEDWETAKQALDLGFYISFSGIITFKNAHEIQEVAKKLPLSSILIETDCPYLAPVPHRGKTNQPSYVKYVAEYLAHLKNLPLEEVAHQTTQNFEKLFLSRL